ncbi:DUF4956 domain-containing protein [Persicitalea jodogahamensis]|uniref:DUF4956 domain-containing protein n=1 Tax=Persicitalea jodogahamensis TaxID=402147 RepID=A0A8J3D159_9BACT|nr:DUF4956 domain-containing protein [Persicitalea jodogahamensis]GHB61808.1 DUF4956 domain-containing protein [Persicitalea jodogahamensis]
MTQLLQQLNLTDGFGAQSQMTPDLLALLARLFINLLAVVVLVRLIYFRIYRKTDLFLTFFMFNLIIFLITYLLNQVQMSIGAAFGLFAVFSMLRYRTEGLSAKDMTYLFVVIAMGLISAVSNGSWVQVALIAGLILLVVQLLEGNWLIRREFSKTIAYDRIALIVPGRRPELLEDIRDRTGLPIHRVDIQDIDFLKDSARITAYYYAQDSQPKINETTHVPLPQTVPLYE